MKNVAELRNELIESFERMKAGEQSLSLGKQLANSAGKILASAKYEHDYNKDRGYDIPLGFFEVERSQDDK